MNTDLISRSGISRAVSDSALSSQHAIWRPALGLAAVMLVTCGLVYSASVTGLAGLLFPQQASGSLVIVDGKAVGSALVAQPFSGDMYFHGRPSSVNTDPMSTGGSNLAPSNPALRDRVAAESAVLTERYQLPATELPVDLLASSGSGVDPHISPEAAALQLKRVAAARGIPTEVLGKLVEQHTEAPQWGIFGQPRVNVLLLNLAVDQQFLVK
ncbi:potassium-transporting ATPase subunit KdpC [Rheinheimera tangshanensis]|uniref:Potassium-transporting ATPase KdpC subunit n=1 Tax=Rheinheimera tangshanensis TaxID=400153 RepID=A0A5C8LU41_9GAMM|nr:potassium-transporting ATPase subunit KdpC [Rheinheimera tangshanensis]TXK80277.1 potassium-transporting ATPase subunit KdpC [Rheinheimera tangshanensis]GGM65642.1 potassium-transporting ATPase KdpC subunit [Rheinheimera tangshanensis]